METKNLSSTTSKTVFKVRKDLFGVHDVQTIEVPVTQNATIDNEHSFLESIWGEGDGVQQPTSNSLLLSPALKRSPNKFSTSPDKRKSCDTPKKKGSTPRKLSKYSPFRKKVYRPNPNNSIKNFFFVKEQSHCENEQTHNSLGIERLCDVETSTSASTNNLSNNSQVCYVSSPSQKQPKENSCISNTTPMKVVSNNSDRKSTPNSLLKQTTPNTTPVKSNGSTPQSVKSVLSPTAKTAEARDLYGSFLLRILLDIMINDSNPDGVNLFSEEEYVHIKTFQQLDQPTQRLYGRLLNRKHDWIRTSTMKYGDVSLQLLLLEQRGFVTTNCKSESLENLLILLTIPDLKALCKSYKLKESGVKTDLISRLISRSKQPSLIDFFKKDSSDKCGESILRKKIHELLGIVIKLTIEPRRTFSRSLLFFSYPHYRGLERDRFSDQLALVSQLHNLSFPKYEVIRSKIFNSREHFLTYEAALVETSALLEAKEDKLWDLALDKLREILKKLKHYLTDEEIRAEVEAMPDFLRKFTAGGCYVRAVSSSIEILKKWEHTLVEAEVCLEMLLEQRLFSRNRRGHWFEQLALLYQYNMKDNVKATQTVLKGLRDEYIDVISRHTLCTRAAMLEGRKKNGLKDYLKDALAKQRGLIESLEEPPSIVITEQILNSCRKGLKQVYVQDSEDGKVLSSVEEVAKEHFKQQGYIYGGHDEGGILKSLIFACFWNEIYRETVIDGHGLFHSEYQTVPLDWNSETFYDKRKEKLKSKLQDLAEGGVDAVVNKFQEYYENHLGTESIVNWKYLEHYEIVVSLIKCIDIDLFLNLSRLLLRHHRTYSAGFPDLTLWDPNGKKCVFVEVKSPNDQLSMKQKVWLHTLNKMGANALVCHVQSVGCKSMKRKISPLKTVCE